MRLCWEPSMTVNSGNHFPRTNPTRSLDNLLIHLHNMHSNDTSQSVQICIGMKLVRKVWQRKRRFRNHDSILDRYNIHGQYFQSDQSRQHIHTYIQTDRQTDRHAHFTFIKQQVCLDQMVFGALSLTHDIDSSALHQHNQL